MKSIRIILSAFLASFIIASCADMDVDPFTIINEDAITTNESGITAYLVTLYDGLPMEDMRYSRPGFNTFAGIPYLMHLTGEAIPHNWDYGAAYYSGEDFGLWNYSQIRDVNKFMGLLEKNKNAFKANDVAVWKGEGYMIRAYLYFGLVKRYGGMPLITQVQNFDGNNLEELQVPRNTEKELYDYIGLQLDSAAMFLPSTNEKGRFTKWAAYTLKSRAMLYAASIAKYGTMDASCPYVGIPSAEANTYFAAAKTAAKEVIEKGGYSLYKTNPDKTDNYTEMFLNENDNPEAILVKVYKYPDKTHNYDVWGLPFAYRSSGGYGSNFCPTLDFVEYYETIDGKIESLPITDSNGKPIEYKDPLKVFEGRDPRLAGTVIFPNGLWRGEVVEVRKGVIEGGKLYPATKFGDQTPKGISVTGNCGFTDAGETTTTGFHLRKYLDFNRSKENVYADRCDQDWIDMRLGEVYLNFAEAAVETGTDLDKALDYINQIRDRAGIRKIESNELTLDKVRHERRIELSFENHTFWDLKRWRIAVNEFNNRTYWALHPYYNADNDSYYFERKKYEPAGQSGKTFQSRFYYLRIPEEQRQKNPKLTQNPGY